LNYTRVAMQHARHKRITNMYQEVLQEREADQVTSLGLSELQCHPRLIQAQHPSKYAGRHTHNQWHRVSDPDN